MGRKICNTFSGGKELCLNLDVERVMPGSDAVLHDEPNRMLMRESKGFFSCAFDSAPVKYGV